MNQDDREIKEAIAFHTAIANSWFGRAILVLMLIAVSVVWCKNAVVWLLIRALPLALVVAVISGIVQYVAS
jgi:hypothetical protein